MLSARASWENTFLTIGLLIATKHCSTWTNYQKYQNNNLVFHQVFHKAAKSPCPLSLCFLRWVSTAWNCGEICHFSWQSFDLYTLLPEKKVLKRNLLSTVSHNLLALKIKSWKFHASEISEKRGLKDCSWLYMLISFLPSPPYPPLFKLHTQVVLQIKNGGGAESRLSFDFS